VNRASLWSDVARALFVLYVGTAVTCFLALGVSTQVYRSLRRLHVAVAARRELRTVRAFSCAVVRGDWRRAERAIERQFRRAERSKRRQAV
jgi:hypothetical protein